jgi:GMP synthase (glutamine-hydrolysing)
MAKFLIINSAEKGAGEFVNPLKEIVEETGNHCHVIEYEETLITNMNMNTYDGIIISGSPRGDDIVGHHLPYFQWIKTCAVPIFGICAGHHITGTLYGAELLRSLEKEVGHFNVYIDQKDPVFHGMPDTFKAHQNHHDSITLPPGFILLAHTDKCRVAMMKHPEKPVYTSQFHPETLNKEMIKNFAQIICKKQ